MIELLYSRVYGGLHFSKKFIQEYENRTEKKIKRYTEIDRYDPVAIQIFKEKGSLWCSDRTDTIEGDNPILLESVPDFFKDYIYISEYDGIEDVRINISSMYKNILDDFLNSQDMTKEELKLKRDTIEYEYYKFYTNK